MRHLKTGTPLLLLFIFLGTQALHGDTNEQLIDAVRANDISAVRAAIRNGADPNYIRDPESRMPLHPITIAVRLPDTEILEYLISNGSDINMQHQPWYDESPSFIDIPNPDDIVSLRTVGEFALRIAMANPNGENHARILLQRGVKIPFGYSMRSRFSDSRELLIEFDITPELIVNGTLSADPVIMSSLAEAHLPELFDMGIDIDQQDEWGRTPLMLYLHKTRHNAEQQRRTLEFLLSQEPDTDIQDALGQTALHYAVKMNNSYAIEAILDAGADPHIRTITRSREVRDYKPLSVATILMHQDAFATLISNVDYSEYDLYESFMHLNFGASHLHEWAWDADSSTYGDGLDFDIPGSVAENHLLPARIIYRRLLALGVDVNDTYPRSGRFGSDAGAPLWWSLIWKLTPYFNSADSAAEPFLRNVLEQINDINQESVGGGFYPEGTNHYYYVMIGRAHAKVPFPSVQIYLDFLIDNYGLETQQI